jgi:hypothetical protein
MTGEERDSLLQEALNITAEDCCDAQREHREKLAQLIAKAKLAVATPVTTFQILQYTARLATFETLYWWDVLDLTHVTSLGFTVHISQQCRWTSLNYRRLASARILVSIHPMWHHSSSCMAYIYTIWAQKQ